MKLALQIALRYLFAKKSHNVINIISFISMAGMAVGTAALIIILSVYNGFDSIVRDSLGSVGADYVITPVRGKVFVPDSTIVASMKEYDAISAVGKVLEDNVFVSYGERQGIAKIRGIDKESEAALEIGEYMIDGSFAMHFGEAERAVAGMGIARNLGINARFLTHLELYYPSRLGKVSISSPLNSLQSESLRPAGVFSVNSTEDNELIFVPIEVMQRLMEYSDGEVSRLEIHCAEGADQSEVYKTLCSCFGDDFHVRDRYRQNEGIYKMMRYEKLAVFMILLFVILVIAVNIHGSLTMLIIEKEDDINTLSCLGASPSLIRRIFVTEGYLVTFFGMCAGLVIGVLIALAQQYFGLVKMPSGFSVTAYPVIIRLSDVLLTVLSISAVGLLLSLFPALRKKSA